MYKPGDILRQQFRLERQLGIGGFSEVWKATDLEARDEVAIKIFLKQDDDGIDLCREEFRRMNYLRHPNILRPRFFSHAENAPFFVMPYCAGGAAMDRVGEFTEEELALLIAQVGAALNHIHALPNPILHNDIKPDNILQEQERLFVLADFGLSDRLSKKLNQSVPDDKLRTELLNTDRRAGMAPMAYRAPELFNFGGKAQKPPSKKTDIWAFGATLYQLATDSLPFDNEGGLRQLTYFSAKAELQQDDIIPELPESFSPYFDALLKRCMDLNPENRPTAQFLVESATQFLNSGEWKKMPELQDAAPSPAPSPQPPVSGASISVHPAEIDFGTSYAGENVSQQVQVNYRGLNDRIHLTCSPPFSISLPGQPLYDSLDIPILSQSGDQIIEVHFCPRDSGSFEDTLYVSHPDLGQETVYLKGYGEVQAAPTRRPYLLVAGVVALFLVGSLAVFYWSNRSPKQASSPAQPSYSISSDSTINVSPPPQVIDKKNEKEEKKTNKSAESSDLDNYVDTKLGFSDAAIVGEPVIFEDETTTNVRVKSRYWDFGDGTVSKENKKTVTHVFEEPGVKMVTLCLNDTFCVSRPIMVNKTPEPPAVCNLELDCKAYELTGASSADRCSGESEKEFVSSAQIILKPQRNLMLKSAVVFSNNSGVLMMTIRDNANADCHESFTQNVIQGRSQINFTNDYTLIKGKTYTLNFSTKEGKVSPNPPKLENGARCANFSEKKGDIVIDYKDKIVLFDLKYCY
jgi:serine/threonine protein kinase